MLHALSIAVKALLARHELRYPFMPLIVVAFTQSFRPLYANAYAAQVGEGS